ncbi:MAG TPA: NADH-quinone oxidoreductase subunit NuoH [Pirellulales bacterium]|jgi:NADH-quinone oxidoreductase subunit H|nr:NADH-quinone oxidoreductase subunit NuoH [Pirellulales bacterium]
MHTPETIVALIKIVLMLGGLMTAAAYLVLVERWIAAWVQDRQGPNRVGIPLTKIRLFGLGQPLADGLKFIFKEDYTPAQVDKGLYTLAPIIILTAALAIFAVIPFGSVLPMISVPGISQPIELIVAPRLDVGLVYVFALSSIAVYGVILGGWASNNKYSFLGGLRSSAQLIAYEIPLGLGILGVVLMSGTLRLDKIITDQATSGVWNVALQPLGLLVFGVASFAEAARLPFDLPEAEQELVGGYHTEYAGMRLLLFLIAEFLHMVTAAFLLVILYFGGWHLWGLTGSGDIVTWPVAILRIVVLTAKVLAMILFFMMVRWSWPRFRFDQLMSLAWTVMLPLGVVNLLLMAVLTEYRSHLGGGWWAFAIISWVVSIGACVVAGLMAPLSVDNRPKPHVHPWDAETSLGD